MRRLATRAVLVIAGSVAVSVAAAAVIRTDVNPEARWAAVAGALAVLTGVLAAWAAVRLVEFEEDERRPDVCIEFDLESRYSLVLLAVHNRGRRVAHQVRVGWTSPPVGQEGSPLGDLDVGSLQPGERRTRLVGGILLLSKYSPYPDCAGTLTYEDRRGKRFTTGVHLSLESRRKELVYTREELRTHHDLQRIPDLLQKMERQLEGLARAVATLGLRGGGAPGATGSER